MRKNLGKKNCELSAEQIKQITDLFLAFEGTEHSKVFPNAAFGYWKIVVDRPLRLAVDFSPEELGGFVDADGKNPLDPPFFAVIAEMAQQKFPHSRTLDYNTAVAELKAACKAAGVKWTASREKLFREKLTHKDMQAEPVIKKKTKTPPGVEYEPDTDLRDTEQVPLLEDGGIETFFQREVLPHVPDAWIDHAKTQIGYEISFTRHFYKPTPLRSLDEIKADLEALQDEAEGLLDEIVVGGAP